MIRKINRIFLMACLLLGITGATACTPVNSGTDGPSTSVVTPDKENEVKIKSIKATETVEAEPVAKMSARKMAAPRKLNSETTSEDAVMAIDEEGNDINYIIIYKSQTDITFTITLDNPEAYGIDDIRITCDDPESQIWLADGNGSGEWQKIQREADGTSVVGWDSANRYERTYNIRTTSEDAINSFKVLDVRLAGHDKFQSKETNSTDLGNNELHIYKMDEDAYKLNVIENTFDYIKFNFTIKDEYKDIISNIRVDGLEMDEELGYWMLEESKEVEVSYDYYVSDEIGSVRRRTKLQLSHMNILQTSEFFGGSRIVSIDPNLHTYFLYNILDMEKYDIFPNIMFSFEITDGIGNTIVPEIFLITNGVMDTSIYITYVYSGDYYLNGKKHYAYLYYIDIDDTSIITSNNIVFKINNAYYTFTNNWDIFSENTIIPVEYNNNREA